LCDREEISRGIAEKICQDDIAIRIGRDVSVVSREIQRNGGKDAYRAHAADDRAKELRARPKHRKIDANPCLKERVMSDLRKSWSPEQVAGRIRYDGGADDDGTTISHEALYQWIYALPKGGLARSGVMLRTKRETRKPRGRARTKGSKIIGMRSIDDRPAEVAGRQVPGHWEGDLIIGKNCASAAATLVERTSRFTQIIALPEGRGSDEVRDALVSAAGEMPSSLIKSITWDQGVEMARHAGFTLATEIDVYFAHAHSPWERGTNENTNGLIREYLPKGTAITDDQRYLNLIAEELNNRPRRMLGWMTPVEKFAELLAAECA
jgi:IS30 family transposase